METEELRRLLQSLSNLRPDWYGDGWLALEGLLKLTRIKQSSSGITLRTPDGQLVGAYLESGMIDGFQLMLFERANVTDTPVEEWDQGEHETQVEFGELLEVFTSTLGSPQLVAEEDDPHYPPKLKVGVSPVAMWQVPNATILLGIWEPTDDCVPWVIDLLVFQPGKWEVAEASV